MKAVLAMKVKGSRDVVRGMVTGLGTGRSREPGTWGSMLLRLGSWGSNGALSIVLLVLFVSIVCVFYSIPRK